MNIKWDYVWDDIMRLMRLYLRWSLLTNFYSRWENLYGHEKILLKKDFCFFKRTKAHFVFKNNSSIYFIFIK